MSIILEYMEKLRSLFLPFLSNLIKILAHAAEMGFARRGYGINRLNRVCTIGEPLKVRNRAARPVFQLPLADRGRTRGFPPMDGGPAHGPGGV